MTSFTRSAVTISSTLFLSCHDIVIYIVKLKTIPNLQEGKEKINPVQHQTVPLPTQEEEEKTEASDHTPGIL